MRIHEPSFPTDAALFIIWSEDRWGRRSLAAGGITAMLAAWAAVQDDDPAATLTLQQGARVLERREPLR